MLSACRACALLCQARARPAPPASPSRTPESRGFAPAFRAPNNPPALGAAGRGACFGRSTCQTRGARAARPPPARRWAARRQPRPRQSGIPRPTRPAGSTLRASNAPSHRRIAPDARRRVGRFVRSVSRCSQTSRPFGRRSRGRASPPRVPLPLCARVGPLPHRSLTALGAGPARPRRARDSYRQPPFPSDDPGEKGGQLSRPSRSVRQA